MSVKTCYRYEETYIQNDFDIPRVRIDLIAFHVIRETPKGYWISRSAIGFHTKPKWVSKDARKRYAYPRKDQAMVNFKARKKKQARIIRARLNMVERTLYEIEKIEEEISP